MLAKMLKYFSLLSLVVLLVFPLESFSQQVEIDSKDEKIVGTELKGIIYKNEFSGGFSFNTHGYSVNFRRSYSPNAFFERGLEVDLAVIRHPKEINSYNPIYQLMGSSSFVYGKLNSLYTLRIGIGENHEIAEKIDIGSVEINYFYYGGLSLGGVKPIYLQINKAPLSSYTVDLVTERYDPNKHKFDDIYGGTIFTNGFSETKIYPGLYAKFGLNFDYKISTKKIGTIETGIVVDYYFKKIPIMAFEDNRNLFLAFYLSFNFGKKWN